MKKLISGLLVYALTVSQVFGQAALLPNAKQTFLDTVGNPLVGGSVTFYVPGSTNKKTTWQDSGQASNNPNPITLDAAGRAVIYGQGVYRQVVKDALNNVIWDAPTTAYGSSVPSGATGTDTAPTGAIMQWSSFTLPTNWQWANGQALSRTTYPDLLTALTISQTSISCTNGSPTLTGWTDTSQIRVGAPVEATCIPTGTVVTAVPSSSTITISNNAAASGSVTATVFPWGNGDGVLTFNVPDLRGRVPAGPDSLGGAAAGRLSIASTITTVSGNTTAAVPAAAGVYTGMAVVSANVPANTTISSVNPFVVTNANAVSGSTSITVTSATGIIAGMSVSGRNITGGTTVSAVSGTTVTLSAAATTLTTTASQVSGSTTLVVTDPTGIASGMTIAASGVTGGTTVSSISGSTVTMSANATATGSVSAVFSGTEAPVSLTFTAGSSIPIVMSAAATATASTTSATYLAFTGANAAGAGGGSQSHTLTAAESAALTYRSAVTDPGHGHTETITDASGPTSPLSISGLTNGTGVRNSSIATASSFTGITVATTSNAGGQPHSIIQSTLTINYIIKVKANTTGAGGVVSLGGMFGDIVCDATFQCAPQGTNPAINTVGLAQQANNTVLANVSGLAAQPVPKTWTQWMDSVCGNTQGMTVFRGASAWNCLSPPASGAAQMLVSSGANPSWSAAATGTVQSVGLALPSIFTVSGSPVTTTGTLTAALNTQSANTVWAGPASGSAAAPTFRSLVTADLPNLGNAAGTSLALGGATLGSNALAVTGTANISGAVTSGGQITSTLATGTAPLVVSSTTQVPNLYVARAALADVATTATSATTATAAGSAPAGTLTGTTLASNVVSSALTSAAGGAFGTAAYATLGTSGATVPLLNGANTHSATNVFNAATSSIDLGANGGNLGIARFFGSTSGSVTVQAAAAAGTGTVFQLPGTNGTNGWVLQTNGSGVTSWVAAPAAGLTVGSSAIASGTTTRVLFDNAGTLGEYSISGTGNVAMTTSPALTTPSLGVATGTSLALGGATLGTNALAVTGTALFNNNVNMIGGTTLSMTGGAVAISLLAGTSSASAMAFGWDGSTYSVQMGSTAPLAWTNGSTVLQGGTTDTFLSRSSAGVVQVGTSATNALGSLNLTNLTSSGTVRVGGFTVSTLPTAGTKGRHAYVTDATACTFLGALTGGGSTFCPVIDNGTAWVGG